MLTITDVTPLPQSSLRLTLSNGKVMEVNVADYLDAPGYAALRNPTIFAGVSVDDWGHGVQWPGDIGIPLTALYRLGKEQTGKAYPLEAFNAWMQRNGLSAAAAARALGLTRRTIVYYHTGSKPIPWLVGLACDGYEMRLQNAA